MSASVNRTALNLLRMPIRVLCTALFAAIPGSSFLQNPSARSAQDLPRIEMQVHQAVNRERRAARILELAWSERLASEARRHAANMADRDFFAHEDPSRGDLARRLDSSRVPWARCAENLYELEGQGDPARRAVAAWMRSPGHRKNMLDPGLREAGVGAAVRSNGTVVIVQELMVAGMQGLRPGRPVKKQRDSEAAVRQPTVFLKGVPHWSLHAGQSSAQA